MDSRWAHVDPPEWLAYLHYGYQPPEQVLSPFSITRPLAEVPCSDFGVAAEQAGDLLAGVIDECLSAGKTHYIPLSGGLDSRALLAGALEAGVDVETVTFGMPGAMDFEYGNSVARFTGSRHQCLDLHEYLPDTAALVQSVRNGGRWTYTFDTYFNRLLTEKIGTGPIVLSGFGGDPVAGAHYNPSIPDDGRALKAFVASQRYTRVLPLIRPEDDPSAWLPTVNALPRIPGLTAYERLDFTIRQVGAIRPIVVDPRADVRTPFMYPDWVEFMFSAPAKWRQRCRLYEAALVKRWPGLFKLPTKNHLGLGLGTPAFTRNVYTLSRRAYGRIGRAFGRKSWLQRRSYNYIDFAYAFREPGTLRELARENLSDLEARGVVPWLRPLQILKEHIEGWENYERELQLLIGLEINLKASCS